MDTKTMAEKEQVRPLAAATPVVNPITSEEEGGATGWRRAHYLRKRRCVLWCCGCCGLTVVVLGIVILILSLTVFKVKDPTLTMNSITFSHFNSGFLTTNDPVSLNATLIADISIKNPNVASFKFDNSTTDFYYHAETVGVAYAPDGKVSAHRTVRMNVTVDVLVSRVVLETNATLGLVTGTELNMTSRTDLNGRVNVLGIYKRDIYVVMNCSLTLEVSVLSQQTRNMFCQAKVE